MRFRLRILRRFLARGPGALFNLHELILAKDGISLTPLSRADFGAPKWKPKCGKTKAEIAKKRDFLKNEMRFFLKKKAHQDTIYFGTRLLLRRRPAVFFFARNRITVTCFRFCRGGVARKCRPDGDGEARFPEIHLAAKSPKTKAPRSRARRL